MDEIATTPPPAEVAQDQNVMKEAELRMWMGELEAVLPGTQKPDWQKRRIAGQRVCELMGVASAIQAISRAGLLSVPPKWPEVDIVPVGGNAQALTAAIRTMYQGRRLEVRVGIKVGPKGQHAAQIAEAKDRGTFELRKKIQAL